MGVLSDAHGNGPAFDRGVCLLRSLGARRFVFLGDAVGYVPSTSAVASIARLDESVECVRGNHECMLLGDSVPADREPIYRLGQVRSRLSGKERALLAGFPRSLRWHAPGGRILFVHGSPADETNGYLYPDSDLSTFAPDADLVLMGHTHRPFDRTCGSVRYVNVGSCGLPRDDGRYGAAALLDPFSLDVRVVRFDIQSDVATVLRDVGPVHPSVQAVFDRRQDDFFGEIL